MSATNPTAKHPSQGGADLYDVVIVGGGVAGGIVAREAAAAGKRVLILEAGSDTGKDWEGYQSWVDTFYKALIKVPNSPYPANPNAPSPSVLDIQKILGTQPHPGGYFVQNGPLPFASDYTRALGGTMLHWLGTCLRMVPNDFRMRTRYGQGVDWPLTYEDLMPYYRRAEHEIGVAANAAEQAYLGIHFEPGYVYPMRELPESYSDRYLAERVDGLEVTLGNERLGIQVIATPQGRNSTPNPDYDGGRGYTPVGAVGSPLQGQRCEGNASCVPICPVQAKYSALKTLEVARRAPVPADIKSQCVASRVNVDPDNGRVTSITYKAYASPNDPSYTLHEARGRLYVLAGNAIENAKLMLASGLARQSGQLGKNLMDHPYMLTWGYYPDRVGPFRGPSSTAGIPTLRDGRFRGEHAAFRVEIANWGWNYAAGAPTSDLEALVDQGNLFGGALRDALFERVQRQMRLGFLVEQLPRSTNAVTIDPAYQTPLGEFRPVINYDVDDYTRAGMAAAKRISDLLFARAGVASHTSYNPADPGYLTYAGEGYTYHGSGHVVGTHRMALSAADGVVDRQQRCFEHRNLYLVGCGSMPTIATSNPTLTMAALAFMSADAINRELADG